MKDQAPAWHAPAAPLAPTPVAPPGLTRARSAAAPVYAALDLGTNNCRLLVARTKGPGGLHVIDAFSRIVRLGEGLEATGHLGGAAIERTVAALKICASK